MNNINLYLTSLEPNIAQNNYESSIGGYASTSIVFPTIFLTSNVGLYDNVLYVDNYVDLLGYIYISINSEIIKVESISSNVVNVVEREIYGYRQMHLAGDTVSGININTNIFNNQYNSQNEQYRCLAIKNETGGIIDNVSIELITNSENKGSIIEMAVEAPKHGLLTDIYASGGSAYTLIDSDLINQYSDNFFRNSILEFPVDPYFTSKNVGQERLILSFDSVTGTFVLESPLPFPVEDGDAYLIQPAPSTRLSTGIVDNFDTTNMYISNFVSQGQIGILLSPFASMPSLLVNDICYIWLKKTIFGGYDIYNENGFGLRINYFN